MLLLSSMYRSIDSSTRTRCFIEVNARTWRRRSQFVIRRASAAPPRDLSVVASLCCWRQVLHQTFCLCFLTDNDGQQLLAAVEHRCKRTIRHTAYMFLLHAAAAAAFCHCGVLASLSNSRLADPYGAKPPIGYCHNTSTKCVPYNWNVATPCPQHYFPRRHAATTIATTTTNTLHRGNVQLAANVDTGGARCYWKWSSVLCIPFQHAKASDH